MQELSNLNGFKVLNTYSSFEPTQTWDNIKRPNWSKMSSALASTYTIGQCGTTRDMSFHCHGVFPLRLVHSPPKSVNFCCDQPAYGSPWVSATPSPKATRLHPDHWPFDSEWKHVSRKFETWLILLVLVCFPGTIDIQPGGESAGLLDWKCSI